MRSAPIADYERPRVLPAARAAARRLPCSGHPTPSDRLTAAGERRPAVPVWSEAVLDRPRDYPDDLDTCIA